MRATRFLLWFATAALAGIGVFALMVWRAVEVSDLAPAEVARTFDAARSNAGAGPPMVVRGADGGLSRRADRSPDPPAPITYIYVLTYHAESSRLSRTEIPFWFYKLKAPAAQFMLGNTGFDLADLGLSAADLEREGPRLVYDDADESGNRWLVWTQGR